MYTCVKFNVHACADCMDCECNSRRGPSEVNFQKKKNQISDTLNMIRRRVEIIKILIFVILAVLIETTASTAPTQRRAH